MKTADYFAAVAAAHDQTIPAGAGSPLENIQAAQAAENSAAANQTEQGTGVTTIIPVPTPSIESPSIESAVEAPDTTETRMERLEARVAELENQTTLFMSSEYHSLLSKAAGLFKRLFAEL